MAQRIKDDDLMLVSRKGQTYKVTGKEVHDFFEDYVEPIPPEIESVELRQQGVIEQFVAPIESTRKEDEGMFGYDQTLVFAEGTDMSSLNIGDTISGESWSDYYQAYMPVTGVVVTLVDTTIELERMVGEVFFQAGDIVEGSKVKIVVVTVLLPSGTESGEERNFFS